MKRNINDYQVGIVPDQNPSHCLVHRIRPLFCSLLNTQYRQINTHKKFFTQFFYRFYNILCEKFYPNFIIQNEDWMGGWKGVKSVFWLPRFFIKNSNDLTSALDSLFPRKEKKRKPNTTIEAWKLAQSIFLEKG